MKRMVNFRSFSLFLAVLLFCAQLCGCAEKSLTLDDQLGLGARYPSKLDYENAVIAFTAAIKIDPMNVPAYIGRGDAYVFTAQALSDGITEPEQLSQEAITSYQNALEDYLTAIELGETDAELYRKAADVYTALGDPYSVAGLLGENGPFLENAIAVGSDSIALVRADGALWGLGFVYGEMSAPFSNPTEIMIDVNAVFGWNPDRDSYSGTKTVCTAVIQNGGSLWYVGPRPYPDTTRAPLQVTDQAVSASAGEELLTVLKTDGSLWVSPSRTFCAGKGPICLQKKRSISSTSVSSAASPESSCFACPT